MSTLTIPTSLADCIPGKNEYTLKLAEEPSKFGNAALGPSTVIPSVPSSLFIPMVAVSVYAVVLVY